jgi:16S rRNA (uracil1498-N3)-methyltransferase
MSEMRLFCSRKRLEDGVFTIIGEEAHHGVTVLRLKPGDAVNIFTEQGSEFACRVLTAGKGTLRAEIGEKLTNTVESDFDLILIQALPKAMKLEKIIVHGSELGLTQLFPVITARSVASGDRRDRWRRLALEATKQCGRRRIAEIEPVERLEKLDLSRFAGCLRLIAAEPPWKGSLKEILSATGNISAVALAVGPEGGFAPEEFEKFLAAGFAPFSMGTRILRTQTASLAAFAAIQFALGDWDRSGNSDDGNDPA